MRFTGALFTTLRAGRTAVAVELTPDAVVARGDDGCCAELPYRHLALTRGGADGRTLFCRAGEHTVCCDDPGFLAALRDAAGRRLDEQILRLAGGGTSRRGLLVAALVALAVLAGLGVAAWSLLAWGYERAVANAPVALDIAVGDQLARSLDPGGPEVHLPEVDALLHEIVQRLEPHVATSGFHWTIRVIDNPAVNAMALPGGQLIVFTGLLRQAGDADQVAGVLGHEMAHVTLRHHLRTLIKAAGLMAAIRFALGDTAGVGEIVRQQASGAVLSSQSREHELEADAEGERMLAAAGLDTAAMPAFFALMKGADGSHATGIAAWFASHPDHDQRIAALEALIPTLIWSTPWPLDSDWEQVQKALGPARP
jgi:Zn-dependent protease with chaperone function